MSSSDVYNDDDPIVETAIDVSGKPAAFLAGKTKTTIINKTMAPYEETKFKVMLELTGAGSGTDRPGLDLVIILDLSETMGGNKLVNMKLATQFVINKLGPIDRLSIIKFTGVPTRLFPLRLITDKSQKELGKRVNAMFQGGSTNISAALQMGLKVLNDRRHTRGRVTGIMLMSDGDQNSGGDAAKVSVGNVPVYTFCLGPKANPKVLKVIAENSKGGTFSDVQNPDSLSVAFSQCLAGLLTVVVQDLTLTVKPIESTMEKVSAGNHQQTKDDTDGSVTISFGDLYDKELRKVIVELLLPSVKSRTGADVLEISYTYRAAGGKLYEANPIIVTITRIKKPMEAERKEVTIEENRLRNAQVMKKARSMADENKLEDAQDMIVEAQNVLEDVGDQCDPMVEMLKSELQMLLKLMKSPKMYQKQGRSFALSSETSHDRQRAAARGDVEKLRLFTTPRMDEYVEQAKSFVEDPKKKLPTVDEDVKQELAADPLAPFIGALNYYLQTAIKSLVSIDKIVKQSKIR